MTHYTLIGQTVVPCGMWEWAMMLERSETRRVRETRIGPFRVSTVFIGIDLSFGRLGRPLLFETMTFLDSGSGAEGFNDCDGRWSTWIEAEQAHDLAVQFLQNEFCHQGEQPEEIEEPQMPARPVRCPQCKKRIERGPYLERRIKRHLMRHTVKEKL